MDWHSRLFMAKNVVFVVLNRRFSFLGWTLNKALPCWWNRCCQYSLKSLNFLWQPQALHRTLLISYQVWLNNSICFPIPSLSTRDTKLHCVQHGSWLLWIWVNIFWKRSGNVLKAKMFFFLQNFVFVSCFLCYERFSIMMKYFMTRGKSLLESWVTTFLPDWQPPLIFVWITSKLNEH